MIFDFHTSAFIIKDGDGMRAQCVRNFLRGDVSIPNAAAPLDYNRGIFWVARTPSQANMIGQSFAPFEIHIHHRLAQAHWKIAL
jgi:hypothetical protein